MRHLVTGLTAGLLALSAVSGALAGDRDPAVYAERGGQHADYGPAFRRIATFANYRNLAPEELAEETVSEIVAATADGMTLVYTDSELERLGLVDIRRPARPRPAGMVQLPGEPTSVDVLGNRYALVAINTSADFVDTGGELLAIDIATRDIVARIDLGGQPDSVKISPDGRYAAVAIENERDEDRVVDGVEGGLPQAPAGYLVIVDLLGHPGAWTRRDVDLRGLATYGADDPEPEFVDINARNEAVVTLQENNHAVIVDLKRGAVSGDFALGSVTLKGVDATEDGVISLSETLFDVPREPDAVAWVGQGKGKGQLIATANEGDLFGGSRGFSLFDRKGRLRFDSGTAFEELAVRHGHYPEDRSENKGSEPEAIEYARFDGRGYLFVGSERGGFVAVYAMQGRKPRFEQLLPAPLAPEGLLAIPQRNLLVVSGESDDPSFGVRSSIMIYRLSERGARYPQLISDPYAEPIPWSALSGMVAVPGEGRELLAVWDSFYSESRIFRIDAASRPARVTEAVTLVGGTGNYDPEGIAIAPDETLWIASEGNASDARPNRLLQVDNQGTVLREVGLPQAILDCRAASTARATLGAGFEGVAILPSKAGYRLLVAQQRGWDYTTPECEALDDDAAGLDANGQPRQTRLWIYDPVSDTWDHRPWTLAEVPERAAWVGLSEITQAPDGAYVVLERDNRSGDFAALKTLVRVEAELLEGGVGTDEKQIHDLLPRLRAARGWVSDKPEGVAITARGRSFLVTDNDGVDDWSGETSFLRLGAYRRLFR